MNHLEGLPIYNLSKAFDAEPSKKIAWKIVKKYFDFFNSEGADETLWFMLVEVISSENDEIKGTDRANLIFFYEYAKALNKALHFLYALKFEQTE